MCKKNLIILTVALSFSSQALAFWGDSVPGPQPLVPPATLLTLASGQGIFMPPIGPQPLIPPSTDIMMVSGQAGGFLPYQPGPASPIEELPMILASADLDEQLDGFEKDVTDITMRELGEIIDILYNLDIFIKAEPNKEVPPKALTDELVAVIKKAGDLGYVESNTVGEIADMVEAWYK